jgi:hypothetical protein
MTSLVLGDLVLESLTPSVNAPEVDVTGFRGIRLAWQHRSV